MHSAWDLKYLAFTVDFLHLMVVFPVHKVPVIQMDHTHRSLPSLLSVVHSCMALGPLPRKISSSLLTAGSVPIAKHSVVQAAAAEDVALLWYPFYATTKWIFDFF